MYKLDLRTHKRNQLNIQFENHYKSRITIKDTLMIVMIMKNV